jgi:hypothetical protein
VSNQLRGQVTPTACVVSGAVTSWIGIIERLFYTSVIIAGSVSWIAYWLAFKVAAQWKSRPNDEPFAASSVSILWNAISILFAAIGAIIAGSTRFGF